MAYFVDSAETINDLVKTLECVFELDEIKEFIKNKLKTMDDEEVRCVCVQSAPLDHIIPNGAMKSILSHIPFQRTVKLVSKNFNVSLKTNEALNVEGNQTDWQSVVKQKGKEIKRLEDIMAETVRKHLTLIDDTKSHLKHLTDSISNAQDETTGSHEYCRNCMQLVPTEEMFECCGESFGLNQRCSQKNKECSNCIRDCESEDCEMRICSDCEFKETPCGMKVCDSCNDYHYKYCGCMNSSFYW